MLDLKTLNSILFYFYLGSSFSSALCAQQVVPQQPAQGTIISRPMVQGQIIQGQPIQGQIISQGQIIQGQPVIQGQIIQGQPIIQGPIIQGPIIQGQPIIQGPITQGPPVQTQPKPATSSKALEAARKKIAELNKQIKALSKDSSKLASVEDLNQRMRVAYAEMEKEVARLKKSNGDINTELVELKKQMKRPAANNDGNAAQQKQLNQLRRQYQAAVKNNESISGEIQRLTKDNTDLKNRLNNMGDAQGSVADLQANLNTANQKVSDFETQNQRLGQEKEQLNSQLTMLSQENDRLRAEYQAASQLNADLDGRVAELSTQNEGYLTSINSLRSERDQKPAATTPTYRKVSADSDFAYEKSQLNQLNADLEGENSLLTARVSELQGKLDQLDRGKAAVALPVANLPVVASASGKYNVKYWIIPFMLVGLGVGLYTYFMEEYHDDERKSKA